jgi:hypothetical protein
MQWVVLVWLAPLGFSVHTSGEDVPRQSLPGGWVYLEGEGIDSIMGAYHDSVSGAFVRVEVAPESVVTPWAQYRAERSGAKPEESVVAGSKVLRVTTPLTEGGCEERTVTLLRTGKSWISGEPETMSWNMGSTLCNDLQRTRFDQLVQDLPVRFGGWPPADAAPERSLEERDIRRVRQGTSWSDVRQRLGPSVRVEIGRDGGFVVSYRVARKWATLRFDKAQRLASTSLGE